MKNLKIATWDMKGFSVEHAFYHRELKTLTLIDFLEREKVDVLALQNVDRRLALKINEALPLIGYHFDHIKSDEYCFLDRFANEDQNPIIIKDNFLNTSEIAFSNGLFINKTYITDENKLSDKFYVVNATLNKPTDDNLRLLSHYINDNEHETATVSPIVVTGRLDIGVRSDEMLKLKKDALDLHDIRIGKCINKKDKYNYMMLNEYDELGVSANDDYSVTDMCRPLVAKVKFK